MSGYFEEDQHQGLEPGVYHATLTAIEDVVVEPFKDPKSGTADNGERWKFVWDIDTDDGAATLSQLTTRKLSSFPTNAWRVLEAFGYKGGKVARDSFIGKSCMVTLGLKQNGWNTFDAFSPIRTKAAPQPGFNLTTEFPDLKPKPTVAEVAREKAAQSQQPPDVDELTPVELD